MDIVAKKTVIDLVLGINELIKQATVTDEIKQQAHAVLDYYVVNPIITQDSSFFDGVDIESTNEMTAPNKWTPFLIHLLKTGYELFKMELERLPELDKLDMGGTIPTPQELINNFVSALSGFYGSNHNDYYEMRSKLTLGLINGETNAIPEEI